MSRVRTPFGPETTAAEVAAGVDLSERTAVVTGGGSGIGVEIARALAGAGASVTLAVRDVEAGRRAARDIVASSGSGAVDVRPLELTDLDSVQAFARAWSGPLDVLVCNAGVMSAPQQRTTYGWELHFATNHLGHMALAQGLHGALRAAGGARVVMLSSSSHTGSPVVFDDLFFDGRAYDPESAYAQSKTANALFAVELTRRWAEDEILANSVMPGGIWTNLQRHWPAEQTAAVKELAARGEFPLREKTPEQGAATPVLLAVSPLLDGVGGRYFEDCQEAEPTDQDGVFAGVRDYALAPEAARRLWETSAALLARAGA